MHEIRTPGEALDRRDIRPSFRRFTTIGLVFVAYFLACRLGLIFPESENILAIIWPAAGIGLASFLLSPRASWPAIGLTIFLAGYVANLTAGRPLFNSAGFMLANVAESFGCALWMRTSCGTMIRFHRVKDVLALFGAAVGINAGTAVLGAGTAAMAGIAPFHDFWKTWVVADGLGIFLVTPLVVSWSTWNRPLLPPRTPRKAVEAAALLVVWTIAAMATYGAHATGSMFAPGPYLMVALLSWPAMRFGSRLVTLFTNMLALVAIASATSGLASLTPPLDSDSRLLLVQLYVWSAASVAYLQHALSKQRDATARALRDSEASFRDFFESMGDLAWVIEPEGRILAGNAAVTRTLGYAPHEVIGKSVLDMHPPERRAEAEEIFAEMMTRARESCPLPLRRKDGVHVPVETRVWPGTWRNKACVFGISKDLSATEEANQRFEGVFRGSPAPMVLSSVPDRRIVDVNAAFLRTFGYTRAEVLGRTAADLGLFVEPELHDSAFKVLAENEHLRDRELRVRCTDGSIREGMFFGELIKGQTRDHSLTVMIDITERKRIERMLRQSEERLGMALIGTRAGLWDWNVRTGETIFDERWAEILGYSLAELQPTTIRTWRGLCHPDDARASDARVKAHFEGRAEVYDCEARMRHKDGHWVWVQDRGKCLEWTSDGRPLRMVGTHVDISDRKRNEELREDIERILRHDLRAPAGCAINVARLLVESPTLSDEDKEFAILLERAGQSMLDLLNLSLELYKIESGCVEYLVENIDLTALLDEVVAHLRMMPCQSGRHVERQPINSETSIVQGTRFLLRMVLVNLLQNALEASPEGGIVLVRIDYGQACAIQIINVGAVPMEIRDRFFEKYVTRGKIKGTGLGTYSAKLMIEAQGGHIAMETSDERNETIVTVTMPV